MIIRDEEKELVQCLSSVYQYINELVVVWNGENPNTEKILKTFKAKIVKVSRKTHPDMWVTEKRIHFAKHRQLSFDSASNRICLWLDADDTFENPQEIPNLLKQFVKDKRMGALWMYYDYEQDKYGNTTMAVWRERFVVRDWFKWLGAYHEEALKEIDCIQSKVPRTQAYIKHHPQPNRIQKSGQRNLEIGKFMYEKEKEEGELDPLTAWNYAKSLNAMNQIEKALIIFKEFIEISKSDAHRYQASLRVAKILRKLNFFDEAINIGLFAAKMKPMWPWAYFDLAQSYFCLERWDIVIFYTDLGFICGDPTEETPMAYDPLSLSVRPLEPFVYALVQKGEFRKAYAVTLKALEFVPNNQYFLNWKEQLEVAMKQEEIERYSLVLYDYINFETNGNKQSDKLKHFSKAIPEIVKDHPIFVRLRNRYRTQQGWENRIVIYCGGSVELWDAMSVKEGIGGSEEAVIYLSQYLVKLGWNVEVYNNCLDEGNYNGVLWQGFWKYDKSQKCAIFISWRDTRPIMEAPEGSYIILWLHDVWKKSYFTVQEIQKLDKIFVLSKWHRDNLPDIPDDKFYITRNGILPSQFEEKVARDPRACIYASSPDRGLDILLKEWWKIRQEVPDANLHVYYGFTRNYDEVHKNDERMKRFKEEVLRLLKQPGVFYHGRVNHTELARAFLSCGLWLYPTNFTEISCITGMKAQSGGSIPITDTVAALNETVQFGVKIEGNMLNQANRDKWTEKVIRYLKHYKEQDNIRNQMMTWARQHFDWKTVAQEWDSFFKIVALRKINAKV